MKRIGYAAHNVSLGTGASRTARLRRATDQVLRELIVANLADLRHIIDWNLANRIMFYRITSNLVPYASHPVNRIDWAGEFETDFRALGWLIGQSGMLVTMHPGQYTVLSSPDPEVAERAIKEIEYHNKVLELLGRGTEAKIVVHLGGAYGDKATALSRWRANFRRLTPAARRRLVIENDERIYTVRDCLDVYRELAVPVAFDVLHHRLNPDPPDLLAALQECLATWGSQSADALPEVHFSSQAPGKAPGAHSESIDIPAFAHFYRLAEHLDFNIMLETKDKELSVLAARRALA